MKMITPFPSLKNATSYIWRSHNFNYKLAKEAKEDYSEREYTNQQTSSYCKLYLIKLNSGNSKKRSFIVFSSQ